MSRTVTALFDSRADAEAARARFITQIKTQSTRIIAKDTVAAMDSVDIAPKHVKSYQDAIRDGCHLLVAEVEAGQDPKRIISQFEQAVVAARDEVGMPMAEGPTYGFIGVTDQRPREAADDEPAIVPEIAEPEVATEVSDTEAQSPEREAPAGAEGTPAPAREVPDSPPHDELRIGMPLKSRRGARVRSVTRETPAEEQVDLNEEHVDVEHRPSERRLSLEDVQAAGLLKERIFEIREMREEPVITKETFVREEVIVRKTVRERTETVRDTVRHTEVEVEEVTAANEQS